MPRIPLATGLIIFLTLVSCTGTTPKPSPASAPRRDSVRAVPFMTGRVMRRGGPPIRLSDFVARVSGITGEGKCRVFDLPAPAEQLKVVSYTMGTPPLQRRVSLYLDKQGQRSRYDEMRGTLQPMSSEPATDISLDFVRGRAQASNQWADSIQVAMGTLAEALNASNLGMPAQMIELVEQRCLQHGAGTR